jgi:hypothetical protein
LLLRWLFKQSLQMQISEKKPTDKISALKVVT